MSSSLVFCTSKLRVIIMQEPKQCLWCPCLHVTAEYHGGHMSWPFTTHCALIFTCLLYILHASLSLSLFFITAVIFDLLDFNP